MWRIDGACGNEAQKILWDTVPYTAGRGLDLGCGANKIWPHAIGVDSGKDETLFGTEMHPDIRVDDAAKLDMFSGQSMDWIFSSHMLEHVEDYSACLSEWWRILKPSGYLVLYLPHKDFYPQCAGREKWDAWFKEHKDEYESEGRAVLDYVKVTKANGAKTVGELYAGTPCANSDHKHDLLPQDIISAMEKIGGWDMVECDERDQENEYSFFLVFKKFTDKTKHRYSARDPKPEKTCGIVRYGAWGDVIQMSSILPGLKAQGYHITLYTIHNAWTAIKHEPLIDRVVLQEKDQVPNLWLGAFFKHLKKKYDKFLNLCETVEGSFLALEDRAQWEWSHEARHAHMNGNYLERLHQIAGVPYKQPQMRFFLNEDEKVWVQHEKKKLCGAPLIMVVLSGSAIHKVYPHIDQILARILVTWPEARIITCGDIRCKEMIETPWVNEKRIIRRSDVWTIRQTMAMAQYCDLVIGPETGVMNAVAMRTMPKIVFLSHSSAENLTRDWNNTYSLYSTNTSCYPCHKMIYNWSQCARDDVTGTAHCMAYISPEAVWHATIASLAPKFPMVEFGLPDEVEVAPDAPEGEREAA